MAESCYIQSYSEEYSKQRVAVLPPYFIEVTFDGWIILTLLMQLEQRI